MENKKKLKDFVPGDQIQLGKYTATLLEKRGVNLGIFVMDTLLDKLYPRAGFKSREDFMAIIRTNSDFAPIARKVTNARLLYKDELYPNEEAIEKQFYYFRNTKNRIVNHRSINAWPDKNLLMDFDPEKETAIAIDPETLQVVKIGKYQPCGVRLLIEVEMV